MQAEKESPGPVPSSPTKPATQTFNLWGRILETHKFTAVVTTHVVDPDTGVKTPVTPEAKLKRRLATLAGNYDGNVEEVRNPDESPYFKTKTPSNTHLYRTDVTISLQVKNALAIKLDFDALATPSSQETEVVIYSDVDPASPEFYKAVAGKNALSNNVENMDPNKLPNQQKMFAPVVSTKFEQTKRDPKKNAQVMHYSATTLAKRELFPMPVINWLIKNQRVLKRLITIRNIRPFLLVHKDVYRTLNSFFTNPSVIDVLKQKFVLPNNFQKIWLILPSHRIHQMIVWSLSTYEYLHKTPASQAGATSEDNLYPGNHSCNSTQTHLESLRKRRFASPGDRFSVTPEASDDENKFVPKKVKYQLEHENLANKSSVAVTATFDPHGRYIPTTKFRQVVTAVADHFLEQVGKDVPVTAAVAPNAVTPTPHVSNSSTNRMKVS